MIDNFYKLNAEDINKVIDYLYQESGKYTKEFEIYKKYIKTIEFLNKEISKITECNENDHDWKSFGSSCCWNFKGKIILYRQERCKICGKKRDVREEI